jgi:hypothetical protein
MPENQSQIPSNRPVWLAIIVLAAIMIAAGSGFVLHAAHATDAGALTGAGTVFAAAVTAGMGAWQFLSGCRDA